MTIVRVAIVWVLAVVVAVTLTGCRGSATTEGLPTSLETVTTDPEATPPPALTPVNGNPRASPTTVPLAPAPSASPLPQATSTSVPISTAAATATAIGGFDSPLLVVN